MGQRHQAFAIARIRPHGESTTRYRCVAAFHHQWCYGWLPLLATHRFLTLIKQKNNADIIRAELRSLDGKFGRWKQKPALPKVPSPYVAFLLGTTWSLDFSDPNEMFASGVSFKNEVLSANMGSMDGVNDDGISVIDITDPTSPAYCFVLCGERIPLSAEGYIREYYPEPDASEMTHEEVRLDEERVLQAIAMLEEHKVMTLDMLVEAWPSEYEPSAQEALQSGDVSSDPTAFTTTTIPTLADLSIGPALQHALLIGDTTDIENMIWLPGKADVVKRTLQEQSPFPDTGLNLLVKISEQLNKVELDLSDFHLTPNQIVKLATDTKDFEVLNLSYNTIITVQDVRVILATFPHVKRIVLLGCTAISDADIYHLVSTEPQLFYHIEAIIHPAFLRTKKEAPYKSAFTYIGVHQYLVNTFSLPCFTPSSIIQGLIDILKPLTNENIFDIPAILQQSMSSQSALAGLPRNKDQTWNQRSVAMFPLTSLNAFHEDGWAFALNCSIMGPNRNNFYGFLRLRAVPPETQLVEEEKNTDVENVVVQPSDPFCELHDLSSFLNEMILEGRPAPPVHAVNELEHIIKIMENEGLARLIEQSEVGIFVNAVRRRRKVY